MSSEISTGERELVLKPREASLFNIFSILFSRDIASKGFIEFFKVKEAVLELKGVLFLSLFLQKTLQKTAKVIALIGSAIETSLNVMANWSSLIIFLKNIMRGRVVTPDPSSKHYVSINGLLDSRVDLDKNIKPGSRKYYAALSAMASKLAYENDEFIKHTVDERWKMKLLNTFNFWDERYQGYTTQCFIFHDIITDVIVVAFRGTEPFNSFDWSTDLDLSFIKLPGIEGNVHTGFMEALGLKQDRTWPTDANEKDKYAYHSITGLLKHYLTLYDRTKVIVTGHSLGGALAILFPAVLVQHNETKLLERLQTVYTFGQPRVGDERFSKFMREQFQCYGVEYFRFVYSHDIVPRIPFDDSALMFKHFGTCIYINCLYEAKTVQEEPMKNYFDLGVYVVTNRIDALWEIIRSFILPYMFGPDYKETMLQKILRIVGLFFPGLPAHGTQDYINATRLATYF